jgi:hypothetical protein
VDANKGKKLLMAKINSSPSPKTKRYEKDKTLDCRPSLEAHAQG